MEETSLVVTGEQIDQLIQWFYHIQKPQELDEIAREYINIIKEEA